MTTPAVELAQYLADNGVGERGGASEFSIHVSREPTSLPINVVTLYDTGGSEPASIDADIRAFALQVRVRSVQYEQGFAVQQQIFNLLAQPGAAALNTPIERTIGVHRYIGIWLVGEITHIGRDDHDRFLFTANYDIHRQPL